MKPLLTLLLLGICRIATGQQELQVHHINVEDGDATLIGIYDSSTHSFLHKILIDGGNSNPEQLLLPYLRKVCAHDAGPTHFDYIILTHYHEDHYNGLLAVANGRISADSAVDPGGYDFASIFPGEQLNPGNAPASMAVVPGYTNALNIAATHNPAFIKAHSKILFSYGAPGSSSLGRSIELGKIGGVPIRLECVAGWGNTLSSGSTIGDPKPAKTNANDFTLAFVLTFGEFRYFIGGDLGGRTEGDYIDQETALISYLAKIFPSAKSISGTKQVAGHLCGFKADHHGSEHSNTASFMDAMFPAVTVTSAGHRSSWHLPSVNYLQLLSGVKPLSDAAGTPGQFSRGDYFTNLYNFPEGASLDQAKNLFSHKPGTSFDYGNNTASSKAGYMIRVGAAGITAKSSFQVYRVDISQPSLFTSLTTFNCHIHS